MARTMIPGIKRRRQTAVLSAAFILFIGVLSAPGQAQQAAKSGSGEETSGDLFRRSPRVFRDVLTSPIRWKKKDYLTLTAVVGTGLLFGLMDEDIQVWSQKHRTARSDDFFVFFTNIGNGAALSGLIGGLYLTGLISGKDGLRKTALLSLESYLATSLFNTALKTVIGRSRPGKGEGSGSFHPFSVRSGSTSCPSGHAASAWSVATVIADRTDNAIVDIVCYGMATLTSISRIHQNRHWTSDVVIGSALGYFTAKNVCRLNGKSKATHLSASFNVIGRRRVLTVSFSF